MVQSHKVSQSTNPQTADPYNQTTQSFKNQLSSIGRGNQLLPPHEQVYISSIVASIFERDLLLVYVGNCAESRREVRKILLNSYLKLNVFQHILFCAFFYLQKYISLTGYDFCQNQTLIVASLALARKYQKGKPTKLQNWKQKLDFPFIDQQIYDLENKIVEGLSFDLQPHTRYTAVCDLFLRVNLDEKIQNFCYYLLDLSIFMNHLPPIENDMIPQFSEGEIGVSIVRISCYFFKKDELQDFPIQEIGYNSDRIHMCCNELFRLLVDRQMQELKHIRHKFKKPRFMEVSKIQFLTSQKSQNLENQKETADEDQKELIPIQTE